MSETAEVLDIRQLSDAVKQFENLSIENAELKAKLNQIESANKSIAEKLDKYEEFASLIESSPVEYFNITLRDKAALQRYFMRLKKDLHIDANSENDNVYKKAEHIIGFLFWWVVNDNTRWGQMMQLYRNAMK